MRDNKRTYDSAYCEDGRYKSIVVRDFFASDIIVRSELVLYISRWRVSSDYFSRFSLLAVDSGGSVCYCLKKHLVSSGEMKACF